MKNQPGQKILELPWYVWVGAWLAIGAGSGTALQHPYIGIGAGLFIGVWLAFTFTCSISAIPSSSHNTVQITRADDFVSPGFVTNVR